MRLKDRVALVIGGSHSIGEAIVIEFARQRAATVVNSRPGTKPPPVVAMLQDSGLESVWEPGDMNDRQAMIGVVNRVVARYGRLDILVVSGAPIVGKADLFEHSLPEDCHELMNALFFSRLECLRAALPIMSDQGYGKVIFITTDAGKTPTPGESVVGAAAAALMFFTRAVGRELARKGIRINCIAPTLTVDTAIYENSRKHPPDHVISKAFAKLKARTPFRLNKPQDIANLAVFLASEESDQISGASLSINGGISFP
jgi:3-oxoacyl-[acyl-carrier protein] reductase